MTGGRGDVEIHCSGQVKTVGALVPPSPDLMLSIELFFALLEEHKVVLSIVPHLIIGGLDLPCLHLFFIKHVRGIHAFNVVLYLGGISGGYTNVMTFFLSFVKFTSILGDV